MESSAVTQVAGLYLAFRLASEEYGLPILCVQEIIGLLPITPVPRAPAFVRGVINLRGKIDPVIDLRVKLDMPPPTEPELCIVIVRIRSAEVGILVDSVSEVLTVSDADVSPAPNLGSQVDASFVRGISKASNRVRFLLDIEAILADFDAEGAANEAPPRSVNPSPGAHGAARP